MAVGLMTSRHPGGLRRSEAVWARGGQTPSRRAAEMRPVTLLLPLVLLVASAAAAAVSQTGDGQQEHYLHNSE